MNVIYDSFNDVNKDYAFYKAKTAEILNENQVASKLVVTFIKTTMVGANGNLNAIYTLDGTIHSLAHILSIANDDIILAKHPKKRFIYTLSDKKMTMYEQDYLESVFEKGYIVKAYAFRRLKGKTIYQHELSLLIQMLVLKQTNNITLS